MDDIVGATSLLGPFASVLHETVGHNDVVQDPWLSV